MVLIAAHLNADIYDSGGDRAALGRVSPSPSSWVVNYMLHRLVFSTCNTSCC